MQPASHVTIAPSNDPLNGYDARVVELHIDLLSPRRGVHPWRDPAAGRKETDMQFDNTR